jgi:hypothetical protein
MPLVLVSDTSVLVDLHRGGILDMALRLPYEFAVPDLLFERELRTWDGPALEGRLAVLVLDAIGVALAAGYRRTDPRLSLPDAFALALAKTGGHTLLAGDASLRALADAEGVDCHGVLWVLDEVARCGLAHLQALHTALTTIAEHPRCRLPRTEVRKRLDDWSRDQAPRP